MLSDETIILDFIFDDYLKGDTAMTLTNPAKDSIFGRTFPAVANANATDYHWTDSVITQGHHDYCILYGHATYIIDGVQQVRCPRCGDNKCHAEHNTDCGV